MSIAELLLTIKDFEQRYSVTRSNIYNRINALKDKGYPMEPEKQGSRVFYSADQTVYMDNLDAHLKAGGELATFPNADGRVEIVGRSIGHPIERPTASQDSMIDRSPATLGVAALIDAIATKLGDIVINNRPHPDTVDPIANLKALEEACSNGWLLSSSQLAPLLGLKTLTGKEIHRYGFICTRAGRNGQESAWKITKN
jgi:hypothetical protein